MLLLLNIVLFSQARRKRMGTKKRFILATEVLLLCVVLASTLVENVVVAKGIYVKKVPKIKILKDSTNQNEGSIFSSLFFGKGKANAASESDGEVLDVTMAKYGHDLAFHVIHPEIGDDGSIKQQEDFVVVDENDKTVVVNKKPPPISTVKPIKKCISWRQTGNCNPNGPREKDKDLPCNAPIHSGSSGYCECENNRMVKFSTCNHDTFICQNECTGSHLSIPVDYNDVKDYFAKSALFEESKPSKINSQLARNKPFFLFILCNCKHDLLIDVNGNPHQNIEDSFPIVEFEKQVRKAKYEDKFTFLYALPNAARAFSLHDQYAKIRGTPLDNSKPWLVIDNIPNGAMNEKFLFPEKHKIPGMKVHDLMDMLQNFLNYKLPLLVRSAPVPETNAGVIPSDAQNKRRMRGVLSNSHVIDVVSDTFREIVLDETRTCFLLIYSPNCPASRNVLPILEEAATQFKDVENVTIAKIDLIHNDLPIRDVVVHHYPTGYLFPAGKNVETSVATNPNGNRRLTSFRTPINFANYKGENTKHDVDKPHGHWSAYTIAHFIKHEVVLPPS